MGILRALWRFFVRLLIVALALILIIVGAIVFSEHQRGWAYALWVSALLLLLATRRKQSPIHWRNDPPSERQLSFAEELGVRYRRGMSKGQVSDLIDEALNARDRVRSRR